ncbi:hypothetical protein SGFS_077230 [Streptomyces graminofaciens]|uniref:PPM-type phosphatase domain-containing protein n=2 Tax=Streptomyces graminofaciens TaxID=68212 RepID=A0ABN5VSP3_9ACTN|nr:hypothetical protein SGFS_077230 [Streptomyces graminofaciens]
MHGGELEVVGGVDGTGVEVDMGGPGGLGDVVVRAGVHRRAVARATLPGSPLAPGAARRFVRAALAEWAELGLPGAADLPARLAEDVLVVVSELVTNAVVHAGTEVELFCRLDHDHRHPDTAPGRLVVEVSDHHPSRPVRDEGAERPYLVERPYEAAEYGRGLRLVAALSEAWGITYRTGVKAVWARLSVDGGMGVVEGAGEAYGGARGHGEGARAYAGAEREGGAAGTYGFEPARTESTEPGGRTEPAWRIEPTERAEPAEPAEPVLDAGRAPLGIIAPAPRHGVERDPEWLNRGALSFLAEASDLLAGQLDEDLVAALAGQLLVPRLADWCAVWLEDEGLGWRGGEGSHGAGQRLARVWHGSENRIEELRRALEKDPPRLPDAVRSRAVVVPWPGLPEEQPGLPEERWEERSGGQERASGEVGHAAGDGEAGGDGEAEGAALAYRLIAGGRPLGTLVIGRAGLLRFPDEVTGLVEDLSRRVALAIGAARQYARQATISRVLQRGLLPGAVAEIPGVASALVYEPCDKGGPSGDFYDLFPAGRGRWCFALGDVQGKGPEAAVVIGLARPWLRLLAREGYGVPDVLDRLNQLLLDDATEAADAAARALVAAGGPGLGADEGPQTRFLSLLYGELVPFDGGVRCTLASAGHPLPLLLGADGEVRTMAEPQTLLGVIEDETYASETFELRHGDTLLCVTDGVTERRSGPHMFDDRDGLADALCGCAGLGAELIAERIRRLVHEFGERPPEDDLALLVLQAE